MEITCRGSYLFKYLHGAAVTGGGWVCLVVLMVVDVVVDCVVDRFVEGVVRTVVDDLKESVTCILLIREKKSPEYEGVYWAVGICFVCLVCY